jgi:hypothetical protein
MLVGWLRKMRFDSVHAARPQQGRSKAAAGPQQGRSRAAALRNHLSLAAQGCIVLWKQFLFKPNKP